MRNWWGRACVGLALVAGWGCPAEDEAEVAEVDAGAGVELDAAPVPVPEANCNERTRRAELEGPFRCATEPELVTLEARGTRFDIFVYESSHPLATNGQAFPCASKYRGPDQETYEAPKEETEACSVAGVRPWHSVRHEEAVAACEAIGWRLCSGVELERACAGLENRAYAWGTTFEPGKCNFREAYTHPGAPAPSEAPSGAFEGCVTDEGVHDVNGNLWEWSSDRDERDDRDRFNHGAGWQTIAELHRDINLVCEAERRVPSFSALSYANPDVGFRCCRPNQGG